MTNRKPDISADETVSALEADERRIAFVRHQMRTAAHRMVSDCERLHAETVRPEHRRWREPLGEALLAARHMLALVDLRLPAGLPLLAGGILASLRAELQESQQRVVNAMTTLLDLVPTDPQSELMLQDAQAVRAAALVLAGEDLPAGQDHGTGSGVAAHRAAAQTPPDLAAQPRLLVVDDADEPRTALARLLQRLGYEVDTAGDGRDGLAQALKERYDLILSDIDMPHMDGFELLERLKAQDETRDVPVIMVSGYDDLSSVVRCIEQGAEDHITKPYDVVLLRARVRASLERKRMRDQELAYLGRVALLTAAAEAVEQETYQPGELAGLASQPDALGRLARVFDRVVTSLRLREEQLEQRLRQLGREIRQSREVPRRTAVSGDGALAVGHKLADRYEILGELGSGGMGTVYRARDDQLKEEIAIKVVRRDLLGQDPTVAERLKTEIRLARRISHRNVVRSHDLGESNGLYFLTMEYVHGITVRELLDRRGRLSLASTLAIGTQLAEALVVAHGQQVIHRDIKPQNLLVDDEGVLKVMDFGLARLVERTTELTQAGFVVGTPRYMAPEQLFGEDVNARSDLYSAGVVLYECLTGQLPFDGSSPAALVARLLQGRARPVIELAPDVPAPLSILIARLLEREPARRPESARELAERLREIA